MPLHRPRHTDHPARTHERGFTLVEILVAMGIILVLVAISISSFRGAKSSTNAKEATAAGAAYAQAIAQWQSDNANRLPGAAAWPTSPSTEAMKGPKNLLGKPYIASPPPGMLEGRIGFSMNANCGTAPAAPVGIGTGVQNAWVSYCPGAAAPDYGVRVLTRRKGSGWTLADKAKVCWYGRTVNIPRCG
jgi:prepilin-type N-terminal cleavage/methylation domain-containing protein